jgi:hypothetical protein
MPDISPRTIAVDYRSACMSAIADALDSLDSVYWAHSYDGELLKRLMMGVMLPIVEGAIYLSVNAWDEEHDIPLTPIRQYPPAHLRDSLVAVCIKQQALAGNRDIGQYPCPQLHETPHIRYTK